jgi:hypothetical protein
MSNSISLRKTVAEIRLGNLITQTLLEILVLSGTAYAMTVTEKNLIVFIAERDQTYQGGGVAGFDINDMPWLCGDTFADQVNFMVGVVDGAIAQTNWDKLDDLSPRLELFLPVLEDLKKMFAQLEMRDVGRFFGVGDWRPPEQYIVCQSHHMLKYQTKDGYHCIYRNRTRVMASFD